MAAMLNVNCRWVAAMALAASLVPAWSPSAGAKTAQEELTRRQPAYMGRIVASPMTWHGASWLTRETRENEENALRLHKWLDVQPGSTVADFGCGNGFHTLPLAAAVGAEGKAYAVDLQQKMLDLLAERAASETGKNGAALNVQPVLATVKSPNLPPNSCDLVLLVDVYHELSDPPVVLRALRSALTENGVVVLVEYRLEDKSVPIKLAHKMSKAQILAEMAANGFRLAAETDELPWQHAMAFEPVDETKLEGTRPRFEAEVMVKGFLDAVVQGDPRVVAPFLAEVVALDAGLPETHKAAAIRIAEWIKDKRAPLIPHGTTFELEGKSSGYIVGRLTPPEGQSLFESRTQVGLTKNINGLWLVNTWLPEQ